MIINHNMGAMNANRQMGINQTNANKSMEKLSSGLRINKAGDDAAGLAISEKMRGQIRGLDQASANSQDAISMIQTAEGALNETHSILQRMRELAVQSSTDTNTTDDRTKIQSEVDQLAKEITRISNTTEFNTQNLMAGGLDNTFQIGANKGQNINLTIGAMDAKSLGVAGNIVTTSVTSAEYAKTGTSKISTESEGVNGKFVVTKKTDATYTAVDGTLAGALTNNSSAYTGSEDKVFTVKVAAVSADEVTQLNYSTDGGTSWKSATWTADGQFTLEDGVKLDIASNAALANGQQGTLTVTADKITMALSNNNTGTSLIGNEVTLTRSNASGVIGDKDTDTVVNVEFDFTAALTAANANSYAATSSTAIVQTSQSSSEAVVGTDGSVVTEADTKAGINVSSQTKANLAIETIDNAIKTVSEERSKLGAYQNRLEHTIANLGTSSENLTSAESRIRDVNMAKEMSTFSKNNILSQAAQAMLAQANNQPQQVLQLLR